MKTPLVYAISGVFMLTPTKAKLSLVKLQLMKS